MESNLDEWLKLAILIATLGNIALTIVLYLRAARSRNDRLTKIEKAMNGLKGLHDLHVRQTSARFSQTERNAREIETRTRLTMERLRAMPTHEDLSDLREGLSDVQQTVGKLDERTKITHGMVQDVHQYLLEKR